MTLGAAEMVENGSSAGLVITCVYSGYAPVSLEQPVLLVRVKALVYGDLDSMSAF